MLSNAPCWPHNLITHMIVIVKLKYFSFLFFSLSAVIEHTNKVIYLEDDDVAVVVEGKLYVHRIKRKAGEDPIRVIQTLQMELQQIMKGPRSH